MDIRNALLGTLRGSWTCGACASTIGPCSPCFAQGCRQVLWTRVARASIPRLGRPKAGRSRPASPMSLCTLPWTDGLLKECTHAVGEKHGGADRRLTGGGPSAGRRTRNGLCECGPTGGRNATAKGHQRQPIWAGSAVCTQARSGASPGWDSRFAGPQIGTVCLASCGAPHARSSTPLANGSRHGSNNTGICRGGQSSSVCMRDCEATTTPMACEGTRARATASSMGPWPGRFNGSTGGEASSGAPRGSSVPPSSTASR